MEKFIWKDIVKTNISVLRLVGLWPQKDSFGKADPYTYYTVFSILCCTSQYSFIAMNISVVNSNFELLIETTLFVTAQGLVIFKMITLITNISMLKQLLVDLDDDVFQPRNVKQILIIKPDIQIWSIIYRTTLASFCSGVFLWASLPILDGSVSRFVLPFPASYPYDTKNPILYSLTYFYQTFATYVLTLSSCNIDMLISALMMYVGAQCDILCDNLRNLGLELDDFGEMLKQCVVHHKLILHFAENCNKFFNVIVLGQFFVSLTCLALALFRLALVTPSVFEFYNLLCVIISIILQTFTYCWFGNKVQTKSEDITYALFESGWTKQCSADKKILIVFGLRTQIPIKLSTFKLFYLTFETFVKILKSAMSYYTVLRQVDTAK